MHLKLQTSFLKTHVRELAGITCVISSHGVVVTAMLQRYQKQHIASSYVAVTLKCYIMSCDSKSHSAAVKSSDMIPMS